MSFRFMVCHLTNRVLLRLQANYNFQGIPGCKVEWMNHVRFNKTVQISNSFENILQDRVQACTGVNYQAEQGSKQVLKNKGDEIDVPYILTS